MSKQLTVFKKSIILFLLAAGFFLWSAGDAKASEDVQVHFDMNLLRLTITAHCEETLMGDICADSIRMVAGTDISIIPSGNIIRIFHNGEINEDEIKNVFERPEQICTARITAAGLKEMLETSVSKVVLDSKQEIDPEKSDSDIYLQVSGFSFTYDVSAPISGRVCSININGRELNLSDDEETFSISGPVSCFDGSIGYEKTAMESIGVTLPEALISYLRSDSAASTEMKRINYIGNIENLSGKYPLVPLALGLLILCAVIAVWRKRSGTEENQL